MGKGKKPFIDRKNAVTFHLVHRSQHDPLVADENAPQHVLVEANSKPEPQSSSSSVQRQEEQLKYGIHFDDDYDYLQHLKEPQQEVAWEYVENPNQVRKRIQEGKVTSAVKLNLPSSVFASEFEEEEGMLNKAAPQPGPHPEWDPDVIAALDDDFDFDDEGNQLDDDFVLQAMNDDSSLEGENIDDESDIDSDDLGNIDSDYDEENEKMDCLGPLRRNARFVDEETKSRFTEYSMSSSVIRRNEQLTLLDDRFEQFYSTYDDPELGDLACENIEGSWHQKHPYVLGCYKAFKKSNKIDEYNKEWDSERLKQYQQVAEGEKDPNEELVEYEIKDASNKWDCESILSTYSNVYNHPKTIDEPRRRQSSSESCGLKQKQTKIEINPKSGMPTNVLHGDEGQLTTKALNKMNVDENGSVCGGPKSLCAKSVLSTLSVLSIRPKDETVEEKRERKRLLKEYRNERRIERKANADAFKEEKKRQTYVKINQFNNQQGSKII